MSQPQHANLSGQELQRLHAIIWDLDGVIIDSSNQHRRSWQQLAAETGISFTDADFWATFGRSNAAIIPLHWGAHLTPA